jgi:GAF domain-containing protein
VQSLRLHPDEAFQEKPMQEPYFPDDEVRRLASLRSLLVLDSAPEERFDALTAYAAVTFDVPIALVSLVDADRQWFKSRCGLGAAETGRDVSFCGHAILQPTVMVVEDALTDSRFADNPLVLGEPHIRFYAGAPLVLADGTRPGTFCLIDRKRRRLDAWAVRHLADLARVASMELQGLAASTDFLSRHRAASPNPPSMPPT